MHPIFKNETTPPTYFGEGEEPNNNLLFIKAITENNAYGIVLMDEVGAIMYQSTSSERISGYTLKEIQSQNFIEFIHADDQDALIALFSESLAKTGIALHRTVKIKHKTEGYRFIQGAMTNLLGVAGVNAIVVTYKDVTKLRETEMQLKKSEADLNTIFGSTDDAIVFIDTNYTISAFNNRAAEIVEKETGKQMCKGQSCLAYIAPERSHILKGMFDVVFRGQNLKQEVHYPKADGSITWYYVRITGAFNDKDSQPLGLTISVSDITKLKHTELALRRSEANLSTIFSNTDDGILLIDTDLKIVSFNQKAQHFAQNDLKHSLKEGDWAMLYFPIDRREFMLATTKKVLEGKNINYEVSYKQPNGTYTWYLVRMVAVLDRSNNKVLGLTMTLTDVTRRKEDEQWMQAMNEQLEAKVEERTATLQMLNKQLEAFTYSVSHDLKMPAYIVNNLATLLSKQHKSNLDIEGQELVNEIAKYSSHMEKLIKDLLLLSKSTTKEVYKQPCYMRKAVYEAISENMDTNLYKHAEVHVAEMLDAYCDANMIRLVWLNLISNALKYSAKREKPLIEIGAKTEGDSIVYYVKDNGIGFDMQHAHKLFEVFQRLHGIEEYEGSGVGLAVVKRIIERHKGKVWVESLPNEGSTFFFSLPMVENCSD